MPKDTVLRTFAMLTYEGKKGFQIVDTIEQGGYYVLVLEWAHLLDKEVEGEMPKKTVPVEKHHFQVLGANTKLPFELVLKKALNIDTMTFFRPDTEVGAEEFLADPENLFTPRPQDDDSV